MKNIKTIACAILMAWICGFALTACSNDDEAVAVKDIVLSADELVFLAEPTEPQTVTFTANADWRATSEQGWILIDTPVGKAGESSLTVSVKQNPNKTERQGNVIITEPSTGKMASFKVKQGAEGVDFVVDKEVGELTVNEEAKTITETVVVSANFDYDVQIKDVDWVTYSVDEANGSVTFYADAAKVPTEAQEIAVSFVPTEEEVEAQSWTLNWPGFTPSVTFYTDEECLNPVPESGMALEETMNGIQAKVYVKSNVPWTVNQSDATMLKEISNAETGASLPRVFTNVTAIFTVFNDAKLDSEDKTEKLSFAYEGSKAAELTLYKAGVGNSYLKIDENVFASLDKDIMGTGFPMFPATGENGDNSKLQVRFSVRSTLSAVNAFVMKYDYIHDTYTPVTGMDRITVMEVPASRSLVEQKNFMLIMPDRSQLFNDDGKVRYFKLFVAETNNINNYFTWNNEKNGFTLREGVTNISEGVTFGQFAYEKEYTFTSSDVSKETPVVHAVGAEGATVTINYQSDEEGNIQAYTAVTLSSDNNYIESGTLFSDSWVKLNYDTYSPGQSVSFIVDPNTTGADRSMIIYLGAYLGEGKSDQYFGAFKIEQSK